MRSVFFIHPTSYLERAHWNAPLDNQEAKILVGQEVPVTTGERLGGNFDAALNPEDRLYDGPALIKAAEGCDGIMCAAGDALTAATIAALPATHRPSRSPDQSKCR